MKNVTRRAKLSGRNYRKVWIDDRFGEELLEIEDAVSHEFAIVRGDVKVVRRALSMGRDDQEIRVLVIAGRLQDVKKVA